MNGSVGKKLDFCLKITGDCLARIKVFDARGEPLLKFAKDYFSDAGHYARNGKKATALEAVAYAHGFIDALILLGFAEIPGYHLKRA